MTTNTDDIRRVIERWADAVHRHDLDGILAHHSDDIVLFDVPPPTRHIGLDAYRQAWEQMFCWLGERGRFALHDLTVIADERVAFAHALIDCRGDDPTGRTEALTVRLTVGLRRVDGRWTVVHEHHSEPSHG